MTTTELLVIVGAGALGYWLVAVMWPNLRAGRAPAPPPLPRAGDSEVMWYVTLGVPSDANRETIVAAYQAKVAEYHPDRIAHLSAEVREQARLRREQLELAYDAAMRDLEWLRPRGSEF